MTSGKYGSSHRRYLAHRGDGFTEEQGDRLSSFVAGEPLRRAALLALARTGDPAAIQRLETEYHCRLVPEEARSCSCAMP